MKTREQYEARKSLIKSKISEIKVLLSSLEEELENERMAMLHQEIDHLEDYFSQAEPHIHTLTDIVLHHDNAPANSEESK